MIIIQQIKKKNFVYYYNLYKNYIVDKVNYNNTSFMNWLKYENLINVEGIRKI